MRDKKEKTVEVTLKNEQGTTKIVKDEGSMGRKLLLYGNKVFHVWNFVCTLSLIHI